MKEYIDFCGLRFTGLDKTGILKDTDRFQQIVTVGAEFIIEAHKNPRLKDLINRSTSTFDGQVPYIFAKRKYKDKKFDKISGADFIYDICNKARENNERIFLLGGYPDSNKGSVDKMKSMGIEAAGFVTGFIPYPFPENRVNEIINIIMEFKPTYLFVGLGMCKQEFFIDENRKALEKAGVKIAVGSGGTFEVFSGKLRRAPKWIQKIGLEGAYRFLSNPTPARFKRLLSTLKFLKYINI